MKITTSLGAEYQNLIDAHLAPGGPFNLGSICFGKKIDLPHSPDLSLKLGWEYSGFD